MKERNRDFRGRVFFTVMIIVILARCAYYLVRGDLDYRNYWGGVIFVPVAIPLLLMLLVVWNGENGRKFEATRKVIT